MTINQFEGQMAKSNESFGTALTNGDALSRHALDLMGQQLSRHGGGQDSRGLNCDDNSMQKGCEGPGEKKHQPKDNEKKTDCDAEKQRPDHRWPIIDPAWGTPHGQGRPGMHERGGDSGKHVKLLPDLQLIDNGRRG